MTADFDVVAAISALGGSVVGAMGAVFKIGQRDATLGGKIDAMDAKIDYICDELARRITVLENRIQYDGLYFTPRAKRD